FSVDGNGNWLALEYGRCRINIRRIYKVFYSLRSRRQGAEREVYGLLQFVIHLLLELSDSLFVENSFAQQEHLCTRNRISRRVTFPLGFRTVKPFVVGERVRIRTDHVRVYERRAVAFAAIFRGALKRRVARDRIRALDFFKVKVRKPRNQP